MNITNQKLEIVKLFTEINKTIKHGMRRDFENIGITMPQGIVIGTLKRHGEMKISELSQKIHLSNSTVTGIIDRLENQQFVVRTRSEEDRRIVYVKVTPKAEEVFEGMHKKAEEIFGDLLNSGTSEDIEKILEGLNTLKKILKDTNE